MSARRRNLAALITAFLVTCAPALAAIVGPDAITYDDDLNIPSNAEVVATQDHPLTLNYTEGIPEGGTVIDDNSIEVTLHTRVLRDPLTQRLTFIYDLVEGEHDLLAGELSSFIMGNFGTVTNGLPSMSVDLTGDNFGTAFLDPEGRIVTETTGGEPHFAAATDATEFDSNGTVSGGFNKGFAVTFTPDDPNQYETMRLEANFTLNGIFQPVADDGGGNGGGGNGGGGNGNGGGNVIPLPAGVWLGLVGLAGTGAAGRFRRRLRLL